MKIKKKIKMKWELESIIVLVVKPLWFFNIYEKEVIEKIIEDKNYGENAPHF